MTEPLCKGCPADFPECCMSPIEEDPDLDDMLARISALEEALRDFQRLYRTEWGRDGGTDASFAAAYERVWMKHKHIDLRTDDELPF